MIALAFCRCGHMADEHIAGGGCAHVNTQSKRFPSNQRCHCPRFAVDPLLPDPEEFLAKALNHVIRKELGAGLEQVDRDDLLQVMRISLWRASTKYDSRSHIRFGSYAAFEIHNDAIDELRSARMFGRRGQYRLQPQPQRPDDDTWNTDPADPLDSDDAGSRRLERVVAELTVDPPDAGDVDLRWHLADGDREALRAARVDGRSTPESPQSGTLGPAWGRGLAALIQTREAA